MNKVIAWLKALRAWSFPTSIIPVVIGSVMAYDDGFFHLPSALAALGVAVLIHAGTNLANDYFDFQTGVDGRDHKGPVNILVAGGLLPFEVKCGFVAAFILAAFLAQGLIIRAGGAAAVIAFFSILAGLLYTAGPWSLARLGLGEIFVLVFFGPVAVAGTYYVQALECNEVVIAAGLLPGFISTAVIALNNLRDMTTDARAGRGTLAVRFGKAFARMEYAGCIIAASFVPVLVHYMAGQRALVLISSLPVFLALPLVHTAMTTEDGAALNRALALTGGLLILQSLMFSFLWLL
jgi:1,4-dihydroxy-2-naphthoate polyprenyltransferase